MLIRWVGLACIFPIGSLLFGPFRAFCGQDPCLILSVPIWTNNQLQLTFLGEYGVPYFIESSPDLQSWQPIATNSDSSVARIVTLGAPSGASFYRARTGSMVPAGLAGLQGVRFNGDNVTVDAFDSGNTNLFPNGVWNSTNAFAAGNVAVLGGTLDIGNARIYGRLLLGHSSAYSLGPFGLVGDVPLNWPPQSGIEGPQWICNNYSATVLDVPVPYNSGPDPSAGSGTNSYVLANGVYYVNGNFSASQNLQVNGVVVLYVTGNFSASTITISPGGFLRLYLGHVSPGAITSASFGNINNVEKPYNFQVFGLPSCTSLVISAEGSFMGTIYAPEATLTVSAGGISTFHYQGACVANSVVFNGHVSFHFDRNLAR